MFADNCVAITITKYFIDNLEKYRKMTVKLYREIIGESIEREEETNH